MSVSYFFFSFGLIWAVVKNDHGISKITVDDMAIIIEYKNATLRAIPVNQIKSITKNFFNQLVVVRNQVNAPTANIVILPNTLENFEVLEQKLNTIQPIIYKNKKWFKK